MAHKCYIGIDNGVTGSIGIVYEGYTAFMHTPVIKQQDYTKAKKNISRLDWRKFEEILDMAKEVAGDATLYAVLERPATGMGSYSVVSAARCFESTLTCLERKGIGYEVIDSKKWQKAYLPVGIKGSAQCKKASKELGIQRYPQFESIIKKQKDADGLFISVFAQKEQL